MSRPFHHESHALRNICYSATVLVLIMILMACLFLGRESFFSYTTASGIITGIIASAGSAICMVLFPRLASRFSAQGKRRDRFLSFFGAVTDEVRGTILLFSQRNTTASTNLSSKIAGKEIPEANDATAEGLNSWLPSQDLRGAIYVAGEISSMTERTPYFRTDADIISETLDQLRATVISFGLGFNQFTHRLITATDHQLFGVEFGPSTKNPEIPKTDNIKLPILDQHQHPTDKSETLVPPPGTDIAIVARIPHPRGRDAPTRCHFICAGRSASGTAVAGKYLAEHWEDILDLYTNLRPTPEDRRKTKKSCLLRQLERKAVLVVLVHRYHSVQSEDDACEILLDRNGKPLIRWWDASENRPKLSTEGRKSSIDDDRFKSHRSEMHDGCNCEGH